tara:strand:+ start:125 stop:466 length:342 start_codon:yes stop_codon:yes gene_type:complete
VEAAVLQWLHAHFLALDGMRSLWFARKFTDTKPNTIACQSLFWCVFDLLNVRIKVGQLRPIAAMLQKFLERFFELLRIQLKKARPSHPINAVQQKFGLTQLIRVVLRRFLRLG